MLAREYHSALKKEKKHAATCKAVGYRKKPVAKGQILHDFACTRDLGQSEAQRRTAGRRSPGPGEWGGESSFVGTEFQFCKMDGESCRRLMVMFAQRHEVRLAAQA